RDFHLKRTKPECAPPRWTKRVKLVKGGKPAAAQFSVKLPGKIPQMKWDTTRLITVVHVVQNDVIALARQRIDRAFVQSRDHLESSFRGEVCSMRNSKARRDVVPGEQCLGEIERVIAHAIQ